MWLEAPVEEDDGRGGKTRTTTARDTGRGVPQGAPISPLFANLYMRRFVLGWKRRGLEARLGAKIVVYADDLVICCTGNAEEAMSELQRLMMQLKLTVNEAKTQATSPGTVCVPGIRLRTVLFAEDGACLSMPATVEGERKARDRQNPTRDRTECPVAQCRGRGAKPRWLAALLKEGHSIEEFSIGAGRKEVDHEEERPCE